MTRKQPRRRHRDVLELVDESARHGSIVTHPHEPEAPLESFEEFYRREQPRLLVLARALAGDLAAEDVAQESMLVAYRQWPRISDLASPVGYVRGICAHKAVSLVRRRLSERRALLRLAGRPVSTVEPMTGDREQFWAEVRRLPRRQAQVTALFYALDLPVSEVAATLGCAEGTVKVHLSRARSELAVRLTATEERS
jgi:RNA polymerase sigma factor (sigma-70 family)